MSERRIGKVVRVGKDRYEKDYVIVTPDYGTQTYFIRIDRYCPSFAVGDAIEWTPAVEDRNVSTSIHGKMHYWKPRVGFRPRHPRTPEQPAEITTQLQEEGATK